MDDRTHSELVSLARARGVTISELARDALVALLDGPNPDADGTDVGTANAPEHLTTVQRYELVLMHRIAATVERAAVQGGGKAALHVAAAEVFERGYTADYAQQFATFDVELSARDAADVREILDMFEHLQQSWGWLTTFERDELGPEVGKAVRFSGFDPSRRRENRMNSYAEHLIGQGQWAQPAGYANDDHERIDSDVPTLEAYGRMMAEFDLIWRSKSRNVGNSRLNVAQLRHLADARLQPDRG